MVYLAVGLAVVVVVLLYVMWGMAGGAATIIDQRDAARDAAAKLEKAALNLADEAMGMQRHKSAMSMSEVSIPHLRAFEVGLNAALDKLAVSARDLRVTCDREKLRVEVPDTEFRGLDATSRTIGMWPRG